MSAIDEDSLIKARPLTVEERPFKRIAKRCAQLPINPNGTTTQIGFEKFREDIELDFELFEITVARIQLLQDTNRREIERYEAEKVNILQLSEQARHDMAVLRDNLVAAQQEKANRLQYDAIANDILCTNSTKAKSLSREEQLLSMQKLESDIAELEEEKRKYGEVWQARREQFGEIVGRLEKMQEQIQEDKEEHDRREGMDEEEGEEGEEIENPPPGAGVHGSGKLGGSAGGDRSGAATPSALSTVPSAGQTPLRQVKDVVMVDAPTAKTEEADKMDTS